MNEEKIRWLKSYRGLLAEIQRLQREIERWRSIAEKVTPTLSAVRFTVPDGSRTENAVEKIDTLHTRFADALSALVDRRMAIETAVDAIPDERLRLVLHYRYIDGMHMEEIAERMRISDRNIRRIHAKAIEALTCPP